MLDYLGIFKELNAKKIKYIVVGGLAVNFYGIPRATYDVDLLLYLEDNNLNRFLSLMKEWDFKPKVPVAIMEFADKNKRRSWINNKNMKAFNLVNPNWGISEIDIIIESPVDYKQAVKKMELIKLQGVDIPTISIDDLIKMKQKANRQQDARDIINLKKVKYEREKNRF